MTKTYSQPALTAPDGPEPLHPSPSPNRRFPYPTPHISINAATAVPVPFYSSLFVTVLVL